MNSDDKNLNRLQLLQLAQQGNEAALAQLLNQALAHKQITTVITLTNNHLKVSLRSPQIPEPWSSKILIDRELLRLHWSGVFTVQLEGYQTGADLPAWTEEFLLGSQAQATQIRTQSPKSLPVEDSDQTRKKHEVKFPAQPIEKAGWQALRIGFLLAVILRIFWPLTLLFNGFQVLVHEIGHAVTYWLFGYPAIPAVNILYGGGITLALGQSRLIIGLIYGAIAFGFYQYPNSRRLLVGLAAMYTGVLLTSLSRILITFMGHGMELVAIVVCLYFAAGGYFCQVSIERPLYAMLGFFLLFSDLKFSWNLIFNSELRDSYEEGIGGVIDNDFVILSRDYLNLDLSILAQLFLIGCIVTPGIAFLLFRYEQIWQSRIRSLFG